MHKEQREQTHQLLQQNQIGQAIFAKPDSIKWLTGVAVPIQMGPNFFASGNPLVWYDHGQFTLIIVASYADLAAPFGKEPDCRLIMYPGHTTNEPITAGQRLVDAFGRAASVQRTGKIGVEREYISDLITQGVRASAGEVVAVDGWLEPLRMVKTSEELEILRRNFGLGDIGHAAAQRAIEDGQREIDIWTEIHSAIQKSAGCRVPLGNDCVVNTRQDNMGGWPLDYALKPNGSLIVDLSVILDGYWSDSCGTYYVNVRTPKQEKIHRTVQQALEYGISLVRPGAVAKEIDQKIRKFIADAGYPVYPHHTGHGVGVSGHEAPRIVPYNDDVLREGMVIMLEPGIYLPGEFGVRLEDGMLVTANGAEVLTHHTKD
jgi:Xaa-Pro aminopeptidase